MHTQALDTDSSTEPLGKLHCNFLHPKEAEDPLKPQQTYPSLVDKLCGSDNVLDSGKRTPICKSGLHI